VGVVYYFDLSGEPEPAASKPAAPAARPAAVPAVTAVPVPAKETPVK
jgi:hypothetical protein